MVAKLTDVAELAGVSPTTVSRVINKKGYLSQKTIDKVTTRGKILLVSKRLHKGSLGSLLQI